MNWLREQANVVLDEHRHLMALSGKDPGSVGWGSVLWHNPTTTSITMVGAASFLLGLSQGHPQAILVGFIAMSAGTLFFLGGAWLDRLMRRAGLHGGRPRRNGAEAQAQQSIPPATAPGPDPTRHEGRP